MSFQKKILQVIITLANGNFQGGGNSLTLIGLRMKCDIEASAGINSGNMDLTIFGLPLSVMNQLSTVGPQWAQQYKNTIKVYAGDATGDNYIGYSIVNPTLVFSGKIFGAMIDAQNMPQVNFHITGSPAGGDDATAVTSPTSLSGTQDVATILQGLAGQMGLQFENNGVSVKVANPYYSGSPYQQAWQLAQHSNVTMVVDRGTMAIMPAGTARSGDTPLISPQTGLVGYPAFNQAVIILRTYFNPSIKPQGKFQVQSDITPACGEWQVLKIGHQLDCLMPHGRWFSIIEGYQQTGQQTPA